RIASFLGSLVLGSDGYQWLYPKVLVLIGVRLSDQNNLESSGMQRAAFIFVTSALLAVFAPSSRAGEADIAPPPVACSSGIPGGVSCIVSKRDTKDAGEAYARGPKLRDHERLEDAFKQFDLATRLVPQDLKFVTAREMVKSQLVFEHVQRGNALLAV